MNDYISVAITLKNRAGHLNNLLHYLSHFVEYDMKKVEICITDGYSNDNLLEVIDLWYKHFYQIKYAISDRTVLPFTIPTNNPACDINAQIANVVTFDRIIRTDAEVLMPVNVFSIVNNILNEDKNALLWWRNYCLPKEYSYNHTKDRIDNLGISFGPLGEGGLCYAFNKDTYISLGGIEEKFALGFAWEDTHLKNNWNFYHNVHVFDDAVYHFDHGEYPISIEKSMDLWHNYSVPLYSSMINNRKVPNEDNKDWQRPEMIKDIKIFRE